MKGLMHLCRLLLGVEENFMQSRSGTTYRSSTGLYFHPFIIQIFRFAKLQSRIQEKIHTKVVIDLRRCGARGEVLEFVVPRG